MSYKISRRKFVTRTALSAAGIIFGSNLAGCSSKSTVGSSVSSLTSTSSSSNPLDEVMKYKKIDSHAHVWEHIPGDLDVQLDYADRLGIQTQVISCPVTSGEATPERFRNNNDFIIKCMKQYPDRFIGQITLNPEYQKESLQEIDRCIDQGMVGMKVYKQLKINDPLYFPIIEKFIDHNMVMLMHSGPGTKRIGPKYDTLDPPTISIPEDFVDIAKR